MNTMAASHRLVRVVSCILGVGGLIGVAITLHPAAHSGWMVRFMAAPFVLVYAGISVAAWALWRGHRLGLYWTRLLLLAQVPFVQSAWFTYWLFTGAGLHVYAGTSWGVAVNLGAQFHWSFNTSEGPGGVTLGANLLALAAFVALGRVTPGQRPPPVPTLPPDALQSAE